MGAYILPRCFTGKYNIKYFEASPIFYSLFIIFNKDHIMSQPTGMGFATGQHYQHVVSQLNAYVHNHGGQHFQSGYDQRSFASPFASQPFHNGDDQMGAAGRAMMRGLFAH